MFETELQFFVTHQSELVAKHEGLTLVIRGNSLIGAYSTPLDAYTAALAQFQPGTFMLQPCEPGPEAYTVTIASSSVGLVPPS